MEATNELSFMRVNLEYEPYLDEVSKLFFEVRSSDDNSHSQETDDSPQNDYDLRGFWKLKGK